MSAKTVTLTKYIPEGLPGPEHFEIVETPAPTEADMSDGDIIVQCGWHKYITHTPAVFTLII